MTLDDALTDVGIAFLQVEFSISCSRTASSTASVRQNSIPIRSSCWSRKTWHSLPATSARKGILSEPQWLPYRWRSPGSALTLDKAWDIAGIRPDPHSADVAVKLGTLVHMVRCAYAHGVADPKWEVRGDYRQVLELKLANAPLRLDLRELHGRSFDFAQLGGHARWFEIRDESLATLTGLNATASA